MTKESLQAKVLVTEQQLATSVTEALKIILKDKNYGDQELEFLRLSLSGDVSRPLFDMSSVDSGFLATAFITLPSREYTLPFPLANNSIS